ncbi:MAG TPA: hypothetical protein VNI77_11355 [Nitrososphaera sp.]|nr:hypothetical protein [Nitrososphaera sp.]
MLNNDMADSMMSYAITAGIFAFLAAVLFGTRAARNRSYGGMASSEGRQPEAA